MYRGTTPTIPIKVKGVDLSESKVFLTFQSNTKKQFTLTTPDDFTMEYDGTDSRAAIFLTQEQTLDMIACPYVAQIRWVNSDGIAGATKQSRVNVNDILLNGVISYE